VNDAVAALRAGQVVAAATETLFGLLADARRPEALDALFSLKARGSDKGVPLLLPARGAWELLVNEIPPLAARLADAFWPGPLSIALPARADVDARLCVEDTVAVRLPGSSPAADLARLSGLVLTATSANPPGAPAPSSAAQVCAAFERALAERALLVVDGVAAGGPPSTLVVVRGPSLRVVREGAVAAREVERLARG
jgi:L-threonylcarbamoyladenylate synthase